MRTPGIVLIFFLLLILTAIGTRAAEIPDVDELIPNEVKSYVSDDLIDTIKSGDSLTGDLLDRLFEVFKSVFQSASAPFFAIVAIVLICGCFNLFADSLQNESSKTLYVIVSSVALASVTSGVLLDLWRAMDELVTKLCALNNAITVSIVSVYTLSGNITSATIAQSNTSIAVNVITNLTRGWAYPVLQVCFGLHFANSLNTEINVEGLASTLRRILSTILTLIMTAMTLILSFQHIFSASADSIMIRGVKMAAGSFIPIVGNAIGEASRTVAAGLGSLKASLGGVCILSIFAAVAPLAFTLFIHKCSFTLGAAFGEVLGLDREGKFLRGCGGVINFAIAALSSITLFFVINLMIFAKSAVVVGG